MKRTTTKKRQARQGKQLTLKSTTIRRLTRNELPDVAGGGGARSIPRTSPTTDVVTCW